MALEDDLAFDLLPLGAHFAVDVDRFLELDVVAVEPSTSVSRIPPARRERRDSSPMSRAPARRACWRARRVVGWMSSDT